MKVLIKILSLVLIINLVFAGCGNSTFQTKENTIKTSVQSSTMIPSEIILDPLADLSGYISNWYGTYSYGDYFKVGKTNGWFAYNYKAILTFDTSSVPENAEIMGVLLGVYIDFENLPEGWTEYFNTNLKAEIANEYGFGGSEYSSGYELKSSDYYAQSAASSVFVYNPVIGTPILSEEIFPYINRNGYTQFRLGFETNPENYLLNFYSENYPVESLRPKLYIMLNVNEPVKDCITFECDEGFYCQMEANGPLCIENTATNPCWATFCEPGTHCELIVNECTAQSCGEMVPVCLDNCQCDDEYTPLCGIDYKTYNNACEAECSRIQVLHEGECGIQGDLCEGENNIECLDGFKCIEEDIAVGESIGGICTAEDYCKVEADCDNLEHAECEYEGTWKCKESQCVYSCEEPVIESEWITEIINEGISPYTNNSYKMWTFTGPLGTKKIRIHFSAFKTEESYDFVNIYNSYFQKIQPLTGDLGEFVTDTIEGSTAYAIFTSDYSKTDEGFRIDKVEYLVE